MFYEAARRKLPGNLKYRDEILVDIKTHTAGDKSELLEAYLSVKPGEYKLDKANTAEKYL